MNTPAKLPQQSRSFETRKRILRESALLFSVKGYHDTKVDQIIKAVKVTSGAFFHHFKGKEDLAFAVIDYHMEERRRALDRIEKSMGASFDNDPLERVFRRLDAVGQMVVQRRNRKGGCLIGNLSLALSDTHPAFRKRLGECFDEMALEFQLHLDEAAGNSGLSDNQDTKEMARYIVSVIEGAIMLTRTHRDVHLIERQVQHLKDDIMRSFQSPDLVNR
jgi:TetR/AcrR family transcriptional repressor of nem operon